MNNSFKIDGYLFLGKNAETIYKMYFVPEDGVKEFKNSKEFEEELFKMGKQFVLNKSNENYRSSINLIYLKESVVLFKVYKDFYLFLFSLSYENELIMRDVFLVFDDIINFCLKENKSAVNFLNNYAELIQYFDDILDDGYIINLNSKDILSKRNHEKISKIDNNTDPSVNSKESKLGFAFNFGKSLFGK